MVLFFSCSEVDKINWVKIKGSDFQFGDNEGKENEQPSVPIKMNDFYLMDTEVTIAQFSKFIKETNYITSAQKNDSSMIFIDGAWHLEQGVNWRSPIQNGFSEMSDHPVTHLTYADMLAYCNWIGGRLPSEVELEFAMKIGGETEMNTWTGDFPDNNSASDGFKETNPVKSYQADQNGVYGLRGNVWEQCADIYHFEIHDKLAFNKKRSQKAYDSQGFDIGNNEDAQDYHVIKGGSFLCHKSYCAGYRVSARQKVNKNESYSHIGFRVAKDVLN